MLIKLNDLHKKNKSSNIYDLLELPLCDLCRL